MSDGKYCASESDVRWLINRVDDLETRVELLEDKTPRAALIEHQARLDYLDRAAKSLRDQLDQAERENKTLRKNVGDLTSRLMNPPRTAPNYDALNTRIEGVLDRAQDEVERIFKELTQ